MKVAVCARCGRETPAERPGCVWCPVPDGQAPVMTVEFTSKAIKWQRLRGSLLLLGGGACALLAMAMRDMPALPLLGAAGLGAWGIAEITAADVRRWWHHG